MTCKCLNDAELEAVDILDDALELVTSYEVSAYNSSIRLSPVSFAISIYIYFYPSIYLFCYNRQFFKSKFQVMYCMS